MDEDTVLKTAGCKSFAGSIPVSSANRVNVLFKKHKWCTSAKGKQLNCEFSDTGSIPKYTPNISPRSSMEEWNATKTKIVSNLLFNKKDTMEKICSNCTKEKDVEEFAFKNTAKGIRHANCNECRREKAKISYNKHKTSVIEKVRIRNEKNVEQYKEFKKTLNCSICGEDDEVCLDFHHLDSTKKDFAIGQHAHYGMTSLKEELKKCICVCSNCHRKIHKYGLEETKALVAQLEELSPTKRKVIGSIPIKCSKHIAP